MKANSYNNFIWGFTVLYGIVATFYAIIAQYEITSLVSLCCINIFSFYAFLTSGKHKIFSIARDEI
jgi:hypothetical protein